MWPFQDQIRMLRYLCCWRVNSSVAVLSNPFSVEISKVLSTIISTRLPTIEAVKWKKSLLKYDEFNKYINDLKNNSNVNSLLIPEVSWPINSVILLYPIKMIYGNGELVLWELKLFGEDASHEFFIEVILPAMEEASTKTDASWVYRNSLWGNFDIDSIYIANNNSWQPLVTNGRLNLELEASSIQYSSNIINKYSDDIKFNFRKIVWLTPFDFTSVFSTTKKEVQVKNEEESTIDATPTLYGILDAFLSRLNEVLEGKRTAIENVWSDLEEEEINNLHQHMLEMKSINVTNSNIVPTYKRLGRWIGSQTFSRIPYTVYPYLELASILHIGRQTHAGCGTFQIVKYPVRY